MPRGELGCAAQAQPGYRTEESAKGLCPFGRREEGVNTSSASSESSPNAHCRLSTAKGLSQSRCEVPAAHAGSDHILLVQGEGNGSCAYTEIWFEIIFSTTSSPLHEDARSRDIYGAPVDLVLSHGSGERREKGGEQAGGLK